MADNRNSYTIPVNTYFPYVIPGATKDYAGVMTADQAAQAAAVSGMLRDNLPAAQLTASIDALATSIPVTTTLGFDDSGVIRMDDDGELISYTSKTETSFDGCTRGIGVVPAGAHAINVAVQQFKRIFVYANASGNDFTGDGSQANPFRTFQKATEYVAAQQMISWNAIWLVNLTGLGKEILPDEYIMPPFAQANVAQFPVPSVGVFLPTEGSVNFFATPTTLATVNDSDIPCKVTDNPLSNAATTVNVVDTTGFPAVAATDVTDAPLTDVATTVNVTDASAFPASGIVKIESELIAYNSKTATSFVGCQRGYAGTTPAAHVATTPVAQVNIIKIDSELITYAGITGTSFTNCDRGMFGSTAASHNLNRRVLLSEEDGMVKYVTSLAAANYQGKFFMGSVDGQYACIANDSSAEAKLIIEVPSTANWTAPFTIGDASAEINRNAAASRNPLLQFISAGQSNLTFAGLKFTNDIGGGFNGIEMTLADIVNFNMCDFGVAFNCVRTQFIQTFGCIFRTSTRQSGGNVIQQNNVYLNTTLRQQTAFKAGYTQCILQGCTPVGQGGDFGPSGITGQTLQNCRIRNGSSHGTFFDSSKSYINNTSIKNCAGSAVRNISLSQVQLSNVFGYGNTGAGVLGDDGSHTLINDARTGLSGATGDLKCGNMAARTLADFRTNAPVKNQFDVPGFTGATTDTTTGTRISQP